MVEETATATAPRRFAPNGAKAALHGGAREPQQPSFVFLRVKRKRHEDPVECLLVASEPETKRQQRETATAAAAVGEARAPSDDAAAAAQAVAQPHDLLAAFTKLSTRERGFVFTRIDTLESHQLSDASDPKWAERLKKKAKQQRVNAKKAAADKPLATTQQRAQQQQARLKERRHSDALRTRGLVETPPKQPLEMREHKTLELSGVRMVELTTVAVPDTAASPSSSSSLTVNGAALGVKRVMNPYEREVDEAVWTAFQHNDFSAFFRLFHAHRPDRRVDPAAFQRPADGGTILMAAAMHGRADVIEAVLRSSAANVLHEDWSGATAAAFALRAGHAGVHTALLACEAAEREKEFVYDVYCIDTSAQQQQQQNDAVASDLSAAPVVSVSSAVQRWLTQEVDQRHDDDDDVDDFVLESDQEDDMDSDGSIDSNHENYAFNDYPDEEDDDDDGSDYDSDDSEQELRHRAAGTGKSRRVDERVRADEVDN